jgi:hypothetical protein
VAQRPAQRHSQRWASHGVKMRWDQPQHRLAPYPAPQPLPSGRAIPHRPLRRLRLACALAAERLALRVQRRVAAHSSLAQAEAPVWAVKGQPAPPALTAEPPTRAVGCCHLCLQPPDATPDPSVPNRRAPNRSQRLSWTQRPSHPQTPARCAAPPQSRKEKTKSRRGSAVAFCWDHFIQTRNTAPHTGHLRAAQTGKKPNGVSTYALSFFFDLGKIERTSSTKRRNRKAKGSITELLEVEVEAEAEPELELAPDAAEEEAEVEAEAEAEAAVAAAPEG